MKPSLLFVFFVFIIGHINGQDSFLSESGVAVSSSPAVIQEFLSRSTVGKSAIVKVNFEALMNSEIKMEALGNTIQSTGQVTEARTPGEFTWSGKSAEGEPFVFTVRGAEISGMFYRNNVMNRLITMNGTYLLYEVNQSEFKPEKCDLVPAKKQESRFRKGISSGTLDCKVRVLFVFTQKALNLMSSSMENYAQACIDIANTAYQNSGINARLEVAHVYKTAFVENSNDMESSLIAFTETSDGILDEVHGLRDSYSADLCVLIGSYGDYCGIAWLYSDYDYSFSVDHVSCAIDNLTFPHELGHNFGAYHDPYVSSGNSKAYGYGYVNTIKRWRTVMAYNNRCSNSGYNCTRIPYFSTPLINYLGDPLGTANQNDNARLHNEEYAFMQTISVPVTNLVLVPSDTVGVFGHAISRQFLSTSGAYTVGVNEKFIFNAGNSIELAPGFSALNGSRFTSEIKTVPSCIVASDTGFFEALNEGAPELLFEEGKPLLRNKEKIELIEWLDALGEKTSDVFDGKFVRISAESGTHTYRINR